MLSIARAEEELKAGGKCNPGPWEQHSISVARNARFLLAAYFMPGVCTIE